MAACGALELIWFTGAVLGCFAGIGIGAYVFGYVEEILRHKREGNHGD